MSDPSESSSGSGGGPTSEDLFDPPAGGSGPDADDFKPAVGRSRAGRWIFVTGIIGCALVGAILLAPNFKGTAPKKRKAEVVATVPAASSATTKAKPDEAKDPAVTAPTKAKPDEATAQNPAVQAPTEPAQAAQAPAPSAPVFGPPQGATITIGCSIPQVDTEVVASCDWAQEGGVVFENLRWEGEVLMGTLVVTLVDGRVYAGNEMAVMIQTKTPTLLAAR